MSSELKRCTRCHQEFPKTTEFFYAQRGYRDGLSSRCIPCIKAYQAEYRATHKEEGRQRHQNWRERNRETDREYSRRYEERHREERRQKHNEYHLKNREERNQRARERRRQNPQKFRAYDAKHRRSHHETVLEATRAWRKENPAKARRCVHVRRARLLNAGPHWTVADVQALLDKQQERCYWCGEPLGGRFHIDHVIPLSKGGTNDICNLAIACPPCNLSKGSKLPHEWAGSSKSKTHTGS